MNFDEAQEGMQTFWKRSVRMGAPDKICNRSGKNTIRGSLADISGRGRQKKTSRYSLMEPVGSKLDSKCSGIQGLEV